MLECGISVDVYENVKQYCTMAHPATIFFSPAHPAFSVFDVEFLETRSDLLSMKFIAQKEFVDCTNTGKLHSGFCTLILDSVMGGSVMGSLDKIQPIATINITTQHSRQPYLNDEIICTGKVERIEDQIAVVSGNVKCAKKGDILASAVGSFMIGTRATPLESKTAR